MPQHKAKLTFGGVLAVVIIAAIALLNRGPQTQPTREGTPPADPPPKQPTEPPAQQTTEPAPAAKTPPSSGDFLRVGSWNIEWLGKPNERSGVAQGVAQTTEDLADYIVESGVRLLAIIEIAPTAAAGGQPRSREIEAALEAVRVKTGKTWAYALHPGRSESEQLTGVAWDTTAVRPLTAEGREFRPGLDAPMKLDIPRSRGPQGSAVWSRVPAAMKFTTGPGRTDLVVVVIHMKADYQGDFAEHRGLEAAALVGALPAVRAAFKDDDLLILGDSNMTAAVEPASTALAKGGWNDLNPGTFQTHWRGGSTDRAFVPSDEPEFNDRDFSVFSDPYLRARRWEPRDFKRRMSDHYMIVSRIRLAADDD